VSLQIFNLRVNTMKKYPAAIQFSLYTAIILFVTAVVIFALYFFSGDGNFAFIGFFGALLFTLLNLIALVVAATAVKTGAAHRKLGGRNNPQFQ
jgi:hypothetical protein